MRIKAYGDRPAVFVPDIGEVVYARRRYIDRWHRAVVIKCWRNRAGEPCVKFQWMEDAPPPGPTCKPIVKNSINYVTLRRSTPPLIKRVDEGAPRPTD